VKPDSIFIRTVHTVWIGAAPEHPSDLEGVFFIAKPGNMLVEQVQELLRDCLTTRPILMQFISSPHDSNVPKIPHRIYSGTS
jgi:hypothetical protein